MIEDRDIPHDQISILHVFRMHRLIALLVVVVAATAAVGWLFVAARTAAGHRADQAADEAASQIEQHVDATSDLLRFAATLPRTSSPRAAWCALTDAIQRELPGAAVLESDAAGVRRCPAASAADAGADAAAREMSSSVGATGRPHNGLADVGGALFVVAAVPTEGRAGLAAAAPLRQVVAETFNSDSSLTGVTVRSGGSRVTIRRGPHASGRWLRSASATSHDYGFAVSVTTDSGYLKAWGRESVVVALLALMMTGVVAAVSRSHYKSGIEAVSRLQSVVVDAVAGRQGAHGSEVPEEMEAIAAQVADLLGVHAEQMHGLSAIRDQERRLVADELHDDAQQALAAAVMLLELEAAMKVPEDQRRRFLSEARGAVVDAQRALNSLIFELYPVTLAEDGLDVALKELAAQALVPGADVAVESQLAVRPPRSIEAVCYRAIRETLRALTRGTKPPTTIRVGVVGDGKSVTIIVAHDGAGAENLAESASGRRASVCELVRSCGGDFGMSDDAFSSEIRMRVPVPAGAS